MDKYTCLNCGTENPIMQGGSSARKFCNRDCQKAYCRKKEAAAAAAKVVASDKRKPLVDPKKRCSRCKWAVSIGHGGGRHCGYMLITGKSRVAMHPEGLTPECQEFEQRQRKHRYQAPFRIK